MPDPHQRAQAVVAPLPPASRRRLVARIDAIRLFAHAYAWHLNLRFGARRPADLLDWARGHGLAGVKIHVEDGEAHSLLRAPQTRAPFGRLARDLGLELHVETSSTDAADLADAFAVARDTGARSVRCYPRHSGPLSSVIARTIADLRRLPDLDPEGRFDILLEQHEDLRAGELVAILQAVGHPRLRLLFDFANMLNAGERPREALAVMAPHVTDVHVKDARILPDRGGWAHRACSSGTGDIDFHGLFADLLLLGDDRPQVRAFALEEEAGMYAPAYRFPDEGPDPVIPPRGPSLTELAPGEELPARLAQERADADAQVTYVRRLLSQLRTAALQMPERS